MRSLTAETSSPTEKDPAHTKSSKEETKPAINAEVAKDSTEECPGDPLADDAGLQEVRDLGTASKRILE